MTSHIFDDVIALGVLRAECDRAGGLRAHCRGCFHLHHQVKSGPGFPDSDLSGIIVSSVLNPYLHLKNIMFT